MSAPELLNLATIADEEECDETSCKCLKNDNEREQEIASCQHVDNTANHDGEFRTKVSCSTSRIQKNIVADVICDKMNKVDCVSKSPVSMPSSSAASSSENAPMKKDNDDDAISAVVSLQWDTSDIDISSSPIATLSGCAADRYCGILFFDKI